MTGSGTQADPYIIQNVTDLQAMENDLTAYYELEGDIDASATSGWNGNAGFDPVGIFTGQLDGKNYTITDLFIDRSTISGQALFQRVNGGVVKNVKLVTCSITGSTASSIVSYVTSGSEITNCSATGSVTGSTSAGGLVRYNIGTVEDCFSECTVVASNSNGNAGGFAYINWGTIKKCYSTGTSAADHAGGFIEENREIIENCYATGTPTGQTDAGGFIRKNWDTITNCYSTGAPGGTSVGGFCQSNTDTITNSFWDTETSGEGSSDGGTGKTTAQMKTKSTFTDAGWNFGTIWYIDGVTNNGYPALGSAYPTDAITRVTSLIHRYDRGTYTLEINLGEVVSDFGLPEWESKPRTGIPKPARPIEPVIIEEPDITPKPRRPITREDVAVTKPVIREEGEPRIPREGITKPLEVIEQPIPRRERRTTKPRRPLTGQ